jgi:hypothetical protein
LGCGAWRGLDKASRVLKKLCDLERKRLLGGEERSWYTWQEEGLLVEVKESSQGETKGKEEKKKEATRSKRSKPAASSQR